MRLFPARCGRNFIDVVRLIECPIWKLDVPCPPVSDLMPLTQVRYHSLFHMVSHLAQYLTAIAKMKVAGPAAHSGVDFIDYPFKRHDRPVPLREVRDLVFDGFQRFLRWLNMRIVFPRFPALPHFDRESEKVKRPFIRIDNFCLCCVKGEPQPIKNIP